MPRFLLVFIISVVSYFQSYSQNCNDGILNGDEIRVDCGGFYCPKCPNNDQPNIQNIMTHSKLGLTYEDGTNNTLIAIDSAGKRAIISCANQFKGYHSVFTVATDGSYIAEIFSFINEQAPFNNWGPSLVDISRDGSKVLWTTGNHGIYVSDFNGDNRIIVADKLKNQEVNSGEIELNTRTSPKFNADGSAIIFSHSANGSKNRGIWEVGIAQTLATNQLLNIEDIGEAFTETIWNPSGLLDFYQLRITENNDIQFLSNLLQENLQQSDLFIYKNGSIQKLISNAVSTLQANGDETAISKDGKYSFWINPRDNNAKYTKLDHESGMISTIDLISEQNAVSAAKRINCNFNGNLLLISGNKANGESQHVLVKSNGEEFYPIHFAHGFLNDMSSIPFIKLSENNEKIVYTVVRDSPNPDEVWVTDVTPSTSDIDAKYPSMESFLITNNKFIPGRLNNSRFSVRVNTGQNEPVTQILFSTFADDTLHLGYYLDPDEGTKLYNDGISYGDASVDDRFEHNDIYYSGQGVAFNRVLPYAFSARFSLYSSNHITTYDVFPLFMIDELSEIIDLKDNDIFLYPTLLRLGENTINLKIDIFFKKALWDIYDTYGRLLKSSQFSSNSSEINTNGLSEGIYFVMINIDGKIVTKKIIIQG